MAGLQGWKYYLFHQMNAPNVMSDGVDVDSAVTNIEHVVSNGDSTTYKKCIRT